MFSYINFHKLNHKLLIVKHNACGDDQNYQQSVHSYPADDTENIIWKFSSLAELFSGFSRYSVFSSILLNIKLGDLLLDEYLGHEKEKFGLKRLVLASTFK